LMNRSETPRSSPFAAETGMGPLSQQGVVSMNLPLWYYERYSSELNFLDFRSGRYYKVVPPQLNLAQERSSR
jgi:hypothetical protein